MSIFTKRNPITKMNDAHLVMSSLGGDRDAFCEIVSRYQNLLCSLAYSSVGDIKYSEDISQETFVEAWKKLDTLKDPEKLKSWLCGILRFKVSRYRRKEGTQPIKGASEFEEHDVSNSDNEQLSRAFFNLIKNSIESIQENQQDNNSFTGKINIEINNNDAYIEFIIIDNGKGFTVLKNNIKDMLNPYFTTKKKGTGLGLSIVNKIINDHNGSINFIPLNNGAKIQIKFIK